MSRTTQQQDQQEANETGSLTESLSSDDSAELGARELAVMWNVEYVYNANPFKLMSSDAGDNIEFEMHDEVEERIGIEGRD